METTRVISVGSKFPQFNKQAVVSTEQGKEFEMINNDIHLAKGKWMVQFWWPKDFTFVCPTEIVEFAKLANDFADRDAVLMGGSTDNEFCKLAWRREHKDLDKLNHYAFGDATGSLVDMLGVRDVNAGVALRATFIVDPDNVIQHVSVNNLNVGRNPSEILRILDGLQTDELCPCNRSVGGATL